MIIIIIIVLLLRLLLIILLLIIIIMIIIINNCGNDNSTPMSVTDHPSPGLRGMCADAIAIYAQLHGVFGAFGSGFTVAFRSVRQRTNDCFVFGRARVRVFGKLLS